jgi:curved DNA-binding protein CbpA
MTPPASTPLPDIDPMRKLIETKAKFVEQQNLFEVLDVPQTVTRDEVKTAYFEAARRFHPDRLASMSLEVLRPEVEKIFRRVSEAYGTLYDDAKREEYKQQLTQPTTANSEEHQKAMKILEAEMAFRRGEILLRKNDFVGAVAEFDSAHTANPQEGEHVIDGTHVPVACTRTGDAAEPAQAPPADLRSALRRGETPSWRFDVQLMPRADIDRWAFDPFDLTKVWPHADYPPRSLGRIVLERDAVLPPLARRPVNRVLPGIGSSPTWPTNIRRAPPTGPRSTPSSASAWRSPSMRSRA